MQHLESYGDRKAKLDDAIVLVKAVVAGLREQG